MPELDKAVENLTNALINLGRQTHAGAVLASAALLDDALQRCLIANMTHKPKGLQKDLFRGYGPLSSFSSKIELAYALGVFGNGTYQELRKIKKIRNIFAHNPRIMSFVDPEIKPLFASLNKPKGAGGTYPQIFVACVGAVLDVLEQFLDQREI